MADFDFYKCLCGLPPYPAFPTLMESLQAKENYTSFGTILHLFLIQPSTISSTTCPETYLQLLSLRMDQDGFWILQHLIS